MSRRSNRGVYATKATTKSESVAHCQRSLLRPLIVMISCFFFANYATAQGQDSSKWSRDLQVIEVMLTGFYANANQTYFDGRLQVEKPQPRADIRIESGGAKNQFKIIYKDRDAAKTLEQIWTLINDDMTSAVRMDITDARGASPCPLYWYREAAQFRAIRSDDCDSSGEVGPSELVLSETQLWWWSASTETPFKLHRAREFTCYADVPGVGGGRDEPYNRYDNLKVHDQGADAWFETDDGRRLGISLFAVDWPINNYEGFFTRDSLVLYILEQRENGSVKEHGYSFTEPNVERIGINLKWMLASCFLVSGRDAVPSM